MRHCLLHEVGNLITRDLKIITGGEGGDGGSELQDRIERLLLTELTPPLPFEYDLRVSDSSAVTAVAAVSRTRERDSAPPGPAFLPSTAAGRV